MSTTHTESTAPATDCWGTVFIAVCAVIISLVIGIHLGREAQTKEFTKAMNTCYIYVPDKEEMRKCIKSLVEVGDND